MQIHEKIEQARVSAGLTQDEMAKKLGIKRSTYQYWEEKTPSVEKIEKVRKALNLPVDYFFITNDEKGTTKINIVEAKEPEAPYENLREKYIQVLEENSRLLNRLLTEKDEATVRVEKNLKTLLSNQLGAEAVTQAYQEYVIRVFWELQGKSVDSSDILKQIENEAIKKLTTFRKEGIRVS